MDFDGDGRRERAVGASDAILDDVVAEDAEQDRSLTTVPSTSPRPPGPVQTGGVTDDEVRAALLDKQRAIAARAAGLTAPPDSTGGISFGKRVGDGTAMAVERLTQVAEHEQLLVQSEQVARALAKLDEGTYGECDSCGQPIPEGRLEIHPWAVLCVSCATP